MRRDTPDARPLRIAQVMGSAARGGAEAFFERLVPALAAAGEAVLAVTRRDSGRRARLQAAGITPTELRFGQPLDMTTGPCLAAALARFRPDVVVSWMNRASRFAGRARRQPGVRWTLVGRLGGYYDLRHYRHCDHLVGNTHDIHGWLVQQGWPAARAHHLPNFVPDFAGAAPAALPVPPGAPRLLAMGRLHPNKGFDIALRALALLPAPAHLALAGEGPERPRLMALAAALGIADRVAFLGWREDAAALLAACDLFLCPSRHEPLGNVVLEAWSAERPVIAAASQGPCELIREGETGILVPRDAPQPLAAAILALLADPARGRTLAAAGRRVFETDHAEAPVLARWREFLRAVAPVPAAV
jgi:glycosyltransferase involved in cell wall biosynthesis